MKITRLKTNNTQNPISVNLYNPVFSWNVEQTEDNWKQNAYRITVLEAECIIWDSGVVVSDKMVGIDYCGASLKSDTRYTWFVEVEQAGKKGFVKSETNYFETALLNEEDWKGDFIGETEDNKNHLFRKGFNLKKDIKKAKLFVCGLGHYIFYLNGNKVGDRVLEPGWTDYDKTYFYSAYDVTDYLLKGDNAAGAMLSDGMYNIVGGRHVYYKRSYGKSKLRVQLNVTYDDGSVESIFTDNSWKMADSPVTFSCIYGGQDHDARLEKEGFSNPEYKENKCWSSAVKVPKPKGRAVCQMIEPCKVKKIYKPKDISKIDNNTYLVDFGYNHSGFIAMDLSCGNGCSGKKVSIKPSEILSDEGRAIQPLTPGGYSWNYICSEKESQKFELEFSYTGYRFAEVTGIVLEGEDNPQGLPQLINIESRFIYPDVEETGMFECSNELFNGIHKIIKQSMLSNMKGYFTDCPQREKLGWIEQTHLIGPSIMYNYGVQNYYSKISMDMEDSQHESGLVPDVCPGYVGEEFVKWNYGFLDSPEWGSACIINPWYVYKFYGDDSIIKRHYDSMRKYILYLKSMSHRGILNHGLGDWLDIGPQKPYSQNTPMQLVATSVYYFALGIMEKAAVLLGKEEDAKEYLYIMKEVYEEYNALFFDDQTNRYATGSQASQALSLISGLYIKDKEQEIADFLEKDIIMRDYAITCGDIGHPFVVAALTKYGKSDVLNKMTNITDKPGYGYHIVNGATTLTEEWDGPEPGNPHGSQNHLMLGSIEEWFFSGLAGISYLREDIPFGEVIIKPHFPEDMDFLDASVMHPYGEISVSWNRIGDSVEVKVTIPSNLTATFINEKSDERVLVGSGQHMFII